MQITIEEADRPEGDFSFMIGTELEFVECDVCRAKPGSPELCRGCLHNREVIGRLHKKIEGMNEGYVVPEWYRKRLIESQRIRVT